MNCPHPGLRLQLLRGCPERDEQLQHAGPQQGAGLRLQHAGQERGPRQRGGAGEVSDCDKLVTCHVWCHFRETGAGPRGDRSRYIETDVGTVQSKYRSELTQDELKPEGLWIHPSLHS